MSTHLESEAAAAATNVAELTYRDAVCAAIEDEMAADDSVLLMGEDVAEAGGVFKTSVGLFERFGPEREGHNLPALCVDYSQHSPTGPRALGCCSCA